MTATSFIETLRSGPLALRPAGRLWADFGREPIDDGEFAQVLRRARVVGIVHSVSLPHEPVILGARKLRKINQVSERLPFCPLAMFAVSAWPGVVAKPSSLLLVIDCKSFGIDAFVAHHRAVLHRSPTDSDSCDLFLVGQEGLVYYSIGHESFYCAFDNSGIDVAAQTFKISGWEIRG